MATVSSSANATERSVPAGVSAGTTAAAATRLARIRKAAASRGIPLAAIVTAVAVVALTSIPAAGALQIVVKELWQATSPGGPLDGEPAAAR